MENDRAKEIYENYTATRIKVEFSLPDGAQPREWLPLPFNEVDNHRYARCKGYDKCLTYAAGKQWIGWTCTLCLQFTKGGKQNET